MRYGSSAETYVKSFASFLLSSSLPCAYFFSKIFQFLQTRCKILWPDLLAHGLLKISGISDRISKRILFFDPKYWSCLICLNSLEGFLRFCRNLYFSLKRVTLYPLWLPLSSTKTFYENEQNISITVIFSCFLFKF